MENIEALRSNRWRVLRIYQIASAISAGGLTLASASVVMINTHGNLRTTYLLLSLWAYISFPANLICLLFGWDWSETNLLFGVPLRQSVVAAVVNALIGLFIGTIIGFVLRIRRRKI